VAPQQLLQLPQLLALPAPPSPRALDGPQRHERQPAWVRRHHQRQQLQLLPLLEEEREPGRCRPVLPLLPLPPSGLWGTAAAEASQTADASANVSGQRQPAGHLLPAGEEPLVLVPVVAPVVAPVVPAAEVPVVVVPAATELERQQRWPGHRHPADVLEGVGRGGQQEGERLARRVPHWGEGPAGLVAHHRHHRGR